MSSTKGKGFVYFGYDASGLFKIGITRNMKNRMRQYRSVNPTFQYLLHMEVDDPIAVEAEIHSILHDNRKTGEWFDLEEDELKWIHEFFTGKSYDSSVYTDLLIEIKFKKLALKNSNPQIVEEFKKMGFDVSKYEVWRR